MALCRGFFNQCCFTGMLSKKVKKLLIEEIVTKRNLFYIQNCRKNCGRIWWNVSINFHSNFIKRITLFQRKLLS